MEKHSFHFHRYYFKQDFLNILSCSSVIIWFQWNYIPRADNAWVTKGIFCEFCSQFVLLTTLHRQSLLLKYFIDCFANVSEKVLLSTNWCSVGTMFCHVVYKCTWKTSRIISATTRHRKMKLGRWVTLWVGGRWVTIWVGTVPRFSKVLHCVLAKQVAYKYVIS